MFSVSVSTFNRLNTIKVFLNAWSNQSVLPNEICIGVDGSTDGTYEYLDKNKNNYPFLIKINYFERIKSIPFGLARCHNKNFEESASEYILITDDDAIPHKNLLYHHINNHKIFNRDVIVIGNRTWKGIEDVNEIYNNNLWNDLEISGELPLNSASCVFNNVSIKKNYLLGVGGYNVNMVHYNDGLDTDLGRRLIIKYNLDRVFCLKAITGRYVDIKDNQIWDTHKL